MQPEKIHFATLRSIFGVNPLVHLLKPIRFTAVKVSAVYTAMVTKMRIQSQMYENKGPHDLALKSESV